MGIFDGLSEIIILTVIGMWIGYLIARYEYNEKHKDKDE